MRELINGILEISRSWIILNFKLVELYGCYGDVQPAMTLVFTNVNLLHAITTLRK
jgi:hypothetical protein